MNCSRIHGDQLSYNGEAADVGELRYLLRSRTVTIAMNSRLSHREPLDTSARDRRVDEKARPPLFSAKGFQALRSRLELSAADFGKLLGVSAQSIYNWESEKARPRAEQIAKLAALRSLGKREVAARLGDLERK